MSKTVVYVLLIGVGFVLGFVLSEVRNAPDRPEALTRERAQAQSTPPRDSEPISQLEPQQHVDLACETTRPTPPAGSTTIFTSHLESLNDTVSSLKHEVECRENEVAWLKRELEWAKGTERQYMERFPEDDIERVKAFRMDIQSDYDGKLEFTPEELHALLPHHLALWEVMREVRDSDPVIRKQRLAVAVRNFLRAAEGVLPPDKMGILREQWEYMAQGR